MKKTVLASAIGMGLSVLSMNSQAALVDGTLLQLADGVNGCIGGLGTFPSCDFGATVVDGSYFAMAGGKVGLHPGYDGGIIIGAAQHGSGSHGGFPDGTENTPIDAAWGFFCNTGFHFTTAPVTVIDNDVNNDGGFTQTLDLSGWSVSWNGIPEIGLPGEATITCSQADCAVGSSYELDFSTLIPPSDQHNFGGVLYDLHLEGTVSAVPLPASAWLLISGLFGLASVARTKKN